VPLDGSRRAAGALPVATDLGSRLGVPIVLVTVVDPTRAVPPTLAYQAAFSGGFPGEVFGGLQDDAERLLAEAAAGLPTESGDGAAMFVKYGNVATCLAEICAPGDVVVMATHGGGHEGWPIGSVAGTLVRSAPVPVLLVRTAASRERDQMPIPAGTSEPQLLTEIGA
jgi:nucleotide-binding universal stress UspA family protein